AGPGVRTGVHDLAAAAVDIAPTALAALGFPRIDGADATGRTASERGVEPDVWLRRQDGRALEEILSDGAERPRRLYVFLLDGQHPTELEDRLAHDPEALPNLRRLRERAAVLASGSIVTFPSITWPSHTSIGTGTWCGHHDVVNPSYYLREKREAVSPQGQQVRTEGFANPEVESLYEAFRRVRGPACRTAAIYAPFGRGADHAPLEGRNLAEKPRLRELNEVLRPDCDPRWETARSDVANESIIDLRGTAQVVALFERDDVPPPDFVYHELVLTDGAGHAYGPHGEGTRAALDESDRRIGRVLDLLDAKGLLDDTLFVVSADHGMAPQDFERAFNPAHHVRHLGMQGHVAEPMIWLRDLWLEVSRAPDGRTGRVIVRDGDALPDGERPPVADARVSLWEGEVGEGTPLGQGGTDAGGVYGFATPSDIASDALVLQVEVRGFNPRTVRLDGTPVAFDLRQALYAGS
ncbi:MAG: alkaline phosphatase family protein, partial [Proteobacteria bacterium]|nr:alkaline phosphatase family protein [Pseudomonadota bacterium]